jgi:phthalate 4,5-dioxygenase reductase subunit
LPEIDETALEAHLPLSLRVVRTELAAEGIKLIELRDDDGGELPAFTAGAHIKVVTPSGTARQYSLCNDPIERDHYVIAVKKERLGRGGSLSMHDDVSPGDLLQASLPKNDFPLSGTAPGYLFVAGGIGITPIRSMVLHLLKAGQDNFRLYYLTASPETTAFIDEMRSDPLAAHVDLHHSQSGAANRFDLWSLFEDPTKDHVYCCGPRGLMDAVKDMTGHWPPSALHFEDFGSDLVRPRLDDRPFDVQLGRDGPILPVPVGRSILEVARAAGKIIPSSCESGTCGTCRVPLLQGVADHRDLVLDDADRGSYIMVCVSRAKSDTLVIDL